MLSPCQYLLAPNPLDQCSLNATVLWTPWQSDKAYRLFLISLRIVKQTNYIEKLFSPWKITLKYITMMFIWHWKPLPSRSPFLHVWCLSPSFELLEPQRDKVALRLAQIFFSNNLQRITNSKHILKPCGLCSADVRERLGWIILWFVLQEIDQFRYLFMSKMLPMWQRGR